MTKYQCMECFEWKYEADLDFNEFLPEENHRETLCKSCADAYEMKIIEQLLPSEEYWEMRDDNTYKFDMKCDICSKIWIYVATGEEIEYGITHDTMTCRSCVANDNEQEEI